MKKLTGEQILEILDEKGITPKRFGYRDFKSEDLGLGKSEEVDQYGGEGQGDDWHSVTHFIDHDVYIRVNGWYSSGYGTEFSNQPYEVFPKQVTITVYE